MTWWSTANSTLVKYSNTKNKRFFLFLYERILEQRSKITKINWGDTHTHTKNKIKIIVSKCFSYFIIFLFSCYFGNLFSLFSLLFQRKKGISKRATKNHTKKNLQNNIHLKQAKKKDFPLLWSQNLNATHFKKRSKQDLNLSHVLK